MNKRTEVILQDGTRRQVSAFKSGFRFTLRGFLGPPCLVPGSPTEKKNGRWAGKKKSKSRSRNVAFLTPWPSLINRAWGCSGHWCLNMVALHTLLTPNSTNYTLPAPLTHHPPALTHKEKLLFVTLSWGSNYPSREMKNLLIFFFSKELIGISENLGVLSTEVSNRSTFIAVCLL